MKPRTIGSVARDTGIPARRIRFYEAEGLLPPPDRTTSGYRAYSDDHVRRLRLIRNARLLGLDLPEIRALIDHAFSSDCAAFAPQLRDLIATQKAQIDDRIAALRALQTELDALEHQVTAAECANNPARQVADCDCCPMIDEEADHTAAASRTARSAAVPRSESPQETAASQGGPMTAERPAPEIIELIEVLACEFDARPRGAPSFDDLAPHIIAVRRDARAVTIDYAPEAHDGMTQLVAAERLCCPGIGWRLDETASRLHITATPAQLDALEQMLTTPAPAGPPSVTLAANTHVTGATPATNTRLADAPRTTSA